MTGKRISLLIAAYFTAILPAHTQSPQRADLSLQGYSGVLNVPDAHIQQQGTLAVLYSNQNEPIPNRKLTGWQDNYLFSIGLFPFLEFGGRLTNTVSATNPLPGDVVATGNGIRDLSANVKVTSAPLTSRYRFSPSVAVGVADPSNLHHYFQTTYFVGSINPTPWASISTGYGRGPDRLKGVFAGGEVRVFDWVTVLADYDTKHGNLGTRLSAPELPWLHARLTATVSAPILAPTSQTIALAGGFSIPLNFKEHTRDTTPATLWSVLFHKKSLVAAPAGTASLSNPTRVGLPPSKPASDSIPLLSNPNPISLVSLQDRLIHDGFVNVRVGQQGNTLVVEYENIRYNHSELDALGVVLGLASRTSGGELQDVRVVVRHRNLALAELKTGLAPLYSWLEGGERQPVPVISFSQHPESSKGVTFLTTTANHGALKPSIVIYPSPSLLLATEHGLFDFQLSIRPELQVPLWRGATAVARADIPVAWSPNLSDGGIYSAFRTPKQLDRAMLFQTVRLAPGLVANLGAGKVLTTTNGTLNELNWIVKGGAHRFNLLQAWGRDSGTTRNVLLGSYRFQIPRYDIAWEATGGRFWAQDVGALVNFQRFFGDTAVSLYLKDTLATDKKRYVQAGLRFDFPLTPRKDMKAAPLQLRGQQDWSISQETGITSAGGQTANYISQDVAIVPVTTESLAVYYYDRERLNAVYILSHASRMKESWLHFGNKL